MNQRKKILIISRSYPYPLLHGGALAQYYFLEHLCKMHDLTFCSYVWDKDDETRLLSLAKALPAIRVVYGRKSINSQSNSILTKLAKILNRKISRLAHTSQVAEQRLQLHYFNENYLFTELEFFDFLAKHLAANRYDVIQLDFFETISLLPVLPKEAKKVFIYHELRSKRFQLASVWEEAEAYRQFIIANVKAQEKAYLPQADIVAVFNDEDKAYLKDVNAHVVVSPYGIPSELITRSVISTRFNRFLILGNEVHLPNSEGLAWFLDEIYLPTFTSESWPLYIAGKWSSTFKSRYKACSKIRFTGVLDSLDEIFENSVLLTPLLSGSGIRTKVLQAFVNKVPVAGTPIAIEGLTAGNGTTPHVLEFSNKQEFIDLWSRITSNPSELAVIAENGFRFYQRYFGIDRLVGIRNELYQ